MILAIYQVRTESHSQNRTSLMVDPFDAGKYIFSYIYLYYLN